MLTQFTALIGSQTGSISKIPLSLGNLGSVYPAGFVVDVFDAAITTDTTAAHAKAR